MTFYNQMVPGNRDDVEIEWHGGPREQGGYATARPAGGSIEAVNEARGRYEQACGAGDINMSAPVPQEQHEAPHGPVDTVPLSMRTITVADVPLTVDPTIFDDFELLESLAEIQRGDILALPTVFRAVAGEQANALLNSIRDGRGRVTATAATEVLVQIMSELAPKA
ncbi:hypothetical protein [Actinomyces bouchesdurhonensis]|uniref:hypothetical protein n=1 Tax=Actinomyces bouchesdurhonensis TaxID=1852361 RepID=UPI0028E4F35D|nr:hypothetical protein [Actinomyces bouchesdurhonensis]